MLVTRNEVKLFLSKVSFAKFDRTSISSDSVHMCPVVAFGSGLD
jgi:hypothetical protein